MTEHTTSGWLKHPAAFLLVAAVLLASCDQADDPQQLELEVLNHSFENGADLPYAWNSGRLTSTSEENQELNDYDFSWDQEVASDGASSLSVSATGSTPDLVNRGVWWQAIPVSPGLAETIQGKSLHLTFSVRTEGFTGGTVYARLVLYEYSAESATSIRLSGTKLSSLAYSHNLNGNQTKYYTGRDEWTEFSIVLRPVTEPSVRSIMIDIGVAGGMQGKAWLDNVRVHAEL